MDKSKKESSAKILYLNPELKIGGKVHSSEVVRSLFTKILKRLI
tara:strand:- start:25839 stop:25970 length:132 start_codon:yes stop_codon:yes gene_type:complete